MNNWQLDSWVTKPNTQEIHYKNKHSLISSIEYLNKKPSIVNVIDIQKLQVALTEAGNGKVIIIQGGDCAEKFNNSLDNSINTVNLLNKLSNTIQLTVGKPVITIGRIAGQFAKPRTNLYDLNNNKIFSYRGDLINKSKLNEISRQPDPNLLIKGYHKSQNIYKSLKTLSRKEIKTLNLEIPHIFTSHEAHNLYYEQALTRATPEKKYYNLSTHFPWVGVRTNKINSAHIEYLRGISNPIAIKINTKMNTDKLIQILNYLNPDNISGRINLITRLGHNKVTKYLPKLIQAVSANDKKITWLCDPMHGNTNTNKHGTKTRLLGHIKQEILDTAKIHNSQNTVLAGLHLELTPAKIKECQTNLDEKIDVSLVDPRLNEEQSEEIVQIFCQAICSE